MHTPRLYSLIEYASFTNKVIYHRQCKGDII